MRWLSNAIEFDTLDHSLPGEPDILNGDYSIKWLEDWLAREG